MRKVKQKIKCKSTFKRLRKYMQDRYTKIVRYLNSDATNAEENVLYLIENEPDFFAEILQLRDEEILKKKRQKFNSINMSESEITRYQKLLHSDLLKIADSLNHELEKQSTSDISLKQRTSHIAKLNNKLEEISKMQELLSSCEQEEKRPVGRPRKTQAEEEIPEDEIIEAQ